MEKQQTEPKKIQTCMNCNFCQVSMNGKIPVYFCTVDNTKNMEKLIKRTIMSFEEVSKIVHFAHYCNEWKQKSGIISI